MFEGLANRLKSLPKTGVKLGDAFNELGSAALLLTPATLGKSLPVALFFTAVGKFIKAASLIIEGCSSEEAQALAALKDPEDQRQLRHLVIQRAYLQEITALSKENNFRTTDVWISDSPFGLLLDDASRVLSGAHNFFDLAKSEALFEPYRSRLRALLKAICMETVELEELVERVDRLARARILALFKENPTLTNPSQFDTLSEILGNSKSQATSLYASEQSLEQIKEVLTSINEKTADLAIQFSKINNSSPPTIPIDAGQVIVSNSLTEKLKQSFDEARSALDGGSILKAEEGFRNVVLFSKGIPDEDVVRLRARSISNTGIVKLMQGKFEEAADLFEEAYDSYPAHPNISALRGLAFHLRGLTKAGIDFLKRKHQNSEPSEGLVTMLAQLISADEGSEASLAFLDSNILPDESWYEIYVSELLTLREFERADAKANEGLETYPDSIELKIRKAVAISQPLTDGQLIRGHPRTPVEVGQLEEADLMFKEACDKYRRRDRKRDLLECLLNRAAIQLALFRDAELDSILNEAALLAPNDLKVLNLVIGRYWLKGAHDEALKHAKNIYEQTKSAESAERLTVLYNANREPEKALELIQHLGESDEELSGSPRIQALKLDALRLGHHRLEADELADNLLKSFPSDPFVLGTLGSFYESRRDYQQAEQLYKSALNAAGEDLDVATNKIQLGEFYYRKRNWAKALEYLPHDVEQPEFCICPREVGHCFLELDKINEAFAFTHAKDRLKAASDLLEIRSWVEFKLYRFDECCDTLRVLIKRKSNSSWALRLVDALIRLGERQSAYGVVRDLVDENSDDTDVLLMASQACYQMGFLREGFEYARSAFLRSPQDQRAKILVTRVMGFDDKKIELSPDEISDLHRALENNGSIEKLAIPTKENGEMDVSPILDRVRSSGEAKREFIERYHSNKAPLSILYPNLSSDIWSVWKSMVKSQSGAIYMAQGSREEQESQQAIALISKRVCVDYSVILTLKELGMLGLLTKKYVEIFTSIDVPRLFQESIEMVDSLSSSEGSLVHDGDRFYFIEQKKDEIRIDIGILNEIADFLKTSGIKPTGLSPSVFSVWKSEMAEDYVTELIFLPIGTALSEGVPLFTDQAVIGLMHSALGGCGTFCTQGFLRACRSDGLITGAEYEASILHLLSVNYEFISISASTVLFALERDQGCLGASVGELLKYCESERCRNESTAKMLGEAAACVWLRYQCAPVDRIALLISLAEAAGAFSKDHSLLSGFISGLFVLLFALPEAIFGIFHVLEGAAKLNGNGLNWGSYNRNLIASSALRGLKSTRGHSPARDQWINQIRVERSLARWRVPINQSDLDKLFSDALPTRNRSNKSKKKR